MKRLIALLLSVALCMTLCACGVSKEESALLESKWINVNDGDVFTFLEGGTGTHDSISISYKVDGATVNIAEGANSVNGVDYTLELEGTVAKLIPADGNGFYVREADYDQIAEQVKAETMSVLTGYEWWTAVQGNTTNYISFDESGYGWFLLPGWTLDLTWEYIDNNTIKLHLDFNGGQTITLDVNANNGNPQLINAKTGAVTYIPKS